MSSPAFTAGGRVDPMDLMFKDGLLRDKRILVTGGGTGLGEVMTEAYA